MSLQCPHLTGKQSPLSCQQNATTNHLWPPLSLQHFTLLWVPCCVPCLEHSSEITPVSCVSLLRCCLLRRHPIQTLHSPPYSPSLHAPHFNDSSRLLSASCPFSPRMEPHEGRDWGLSQSALCPVAYHSGLCSYRHRHRLLVRPAGWQLEACSSDSLLFVCFFFFYPSSEHPREVRARGLPDSVILLKPQGMVLNLGVWTLGISFGWWL